MMGNIELVVLSFLASAGFAVVFRMEKKLLPLAGLGGALTRIVLILLKTYVTTNGLLFMLLSAMFASLYAEVMATRMKRPATVFLYPSIVPLIPGDLLYYATVGALTSNTEQVAHYGPACLQAVCGMAVGFVIISTLMHYRNGGHLLPLSSLLPGKKRK